MQNKDKIYFCNLILCDMISDGMNMERINRIMALYNNRIVVKVGTSTLTNDSGKSDLRATDRLVCTLADIQNMGYEVILVSSGAIAVGRNKLSMKGRPDYNSMRMKQAAAAVGQCSLMYLYDKFFGDYDKTVAQILLNAEDIEQEEKKENLTNTFDALLEMGVIYNGMADRQQALNCLNEVLRMNPGNTRARVHVEMINSILNYYCKDLLNP